LAEGGRLAAAALPVGGIKASVGHSEPASGAVGLLKLLSALQHARAAPNAQLRTPNASLDVRRLGDAACSLPTQLAALRQAQPEGVAAGAVSSFGFAGTIAHAILAAPPVGGAVGGEGAPLRPGGCAFAAFRRRSYPWQAEGPARSDGPGRDGMAAPAPGAAAAAGAEDELRAVLEAVERTAGAPLGADAPLVEAGLDSLSLAELGNQLELSGAALPSTLFHRLDGMTPRKLAAEIRGGGAAPARRRSELRLLRAFKEGVGGGVPAATENSRAPPLVIVPTIYGDSRGYERLWNMCLLGRDVYCLTHPGVEDASAASVTDTTAEEVLQGYADALIRSLGAAPFDLIGTSFGATLAHHVAHRARASGGTPRRLVLVDPIAPFPPNYHPKPFGLRDAAKVLLHTASADAITDDTPDADAAWPELASLPESMLGVYVAEQTAGRRAPLGPEGLLAEAASISRRLHVIRQNNVFLQDTWAREVRPFAPAGPAAGASGSPANLLILSSERAAFFAEVFPALPDDRVEKYGEGRRLRVGGSHFDVAARTISNRVPLATAAMEEFLSAGHAATDEGADRGGGGGGWSHPSFDAAVVPLMDCAPLSLSRLLTVCVLPTAHAAAGAYRDLAPHLPGHAVELRLPPEGGKPPAAALEALLRLSDERACAELVFVGLNAWADATRRVARELQRAAPVRVVLVDLVAPRSERADLRPASGLAGMLVRCLPQTEEGRAAGMEGSETAAAGEGGGPAGGPPLQRATAGAGLPPLPVEVVSVQSGAEGAAVLTTRAASETLCTPELVDAVAARVRAIEAAMLLRGEAAAAAVRSLAAELLRGVDPATPLADAGLDVEAAMQFGVRLQALVGELPPTVARDYPTLRALEVYVANRETTVAAGDGGWGSRLQSWWERVKERALG